MTTLGSTSRYPRLRRLSLFVLGMVLFFTAAALYLQTRHAFQHVMVPLLTAVVRGQLHVDAGKLTLPASLELAGLAYRDAENGLSLHIDRLVIRLSPRASLRDRLLVVANLDLTSAHLLVSLGVTPPSHPIDKRTAAAEPSAIGPFVIHRARLENIAVTIQSNEQHFAGLVETVALDDIGPGRTGTIDLRSDVRYRQRSGERPWIGAFRLNGVLDISRDGRRVEWNVSYPLTVRAWPEYVALANSSALTLNQAMTGHYDWSESSLQTNASLTLRQGGVSLGRLSLQFSRTASSESQDMDIGITVQEISDKMVNVWLSDAGSFRLRSSHLSGFLNVHAVGERYDVRSTITALKLQAVLGSETTQPLDIDLAQVGTFDLGARTAVMDILQVRVSEGRRVWLAGELKDSMRLRLASEGEGKVHTPAEPSAQGDWRLTVNEVDVEELRRWFDVFGWKGLEGIRAGQLGGVVDVSGRNGNSLDFDARIGMSNVKMASADRRTTGARFASVHEIHATISDLTHLHLRSWITTTSVNDEPVGTFRLSGDLNLNAPTTDVGLKGSLTLADLPGESLNPLLSLWSGARIDRARLNGTADIEMTGDRFGWEIELRGNHISLRPHDRHQTTAPLDAVVTTSGSFNRTTGVLRLNQLVVQELDRSRPVLTATLDNPVRFALTGKHADAEAPRSPAGQVAHFTVEVRRLGVDQLRPRLAMWNVAALDGVDSGVLDGRWDAQWEGDSGTLSLTGSLHASGVRLQAGAVHIVVPLALRATFDAAITEFSKVRVNGLNLRALAGTKPIADVTLSGRTNADDGAADLTVTFKTDTMPLLLDRIGLLDNRSRTRFIGGGVSAETRLRTSEKDHPLSIQTTIQARDVRIRPAPGHVLTYSLLTQGTAELNAAQTVIQLTNLDITAESQGKEAGTLAVTGTWPIAESGHDGALSVVAKNLDAAPLADLFKVFPGRTHGPLALNATLAVAQDRTNGLLSLRGQETLGPLRVTRQDKGPEEATLTIEHNLSRRPDEMRIKNLTLTADRPAGHADRVTATGSVRLTGRPGARITGDLASLDAAWYEALFSSSSDKAVAGPKQAVAKARADQREPSETFALLANLDAEVSIGSIDYRKMRIGPGRLVAKGTGDRLEAKLEPTSMADGRVEARVTLVRRNDLGELAWSGNGQGLSMETIMRTVEPGEEPRLKGTASFTTLGNGLLDHEPLHKHLNGSIEFTIADGQFIRSDMLTFLAKYTHVQELEHMGFSGLQGKVRFEDGWIHADPIAATGVVASLDGNTSIGPDGTVDGKIFVKIGPSLAGSIKIPCMSALLSLPDGFTTLPFAVRIKGSAEDPSFSIDTAVWNYAEGAVTSVAGKIKTLLLGCREDPGEGRRQ